MEMCDEMKKLRSLLDAKGVKWTDLSEVMSESRIEASMQCSNYEFDRNMFDLTFYRTHFEVNNRKYSVIYGYGTYGGYDPVFHKDNKLLELWEIDHGDPHGWLTAEEVIKECFGDVDETNN